MGTLKFKEKKLCFFYSLLGNLGEQLSPLRERYSPPLTLYEYFYTQNKQTNNNNKGRERLCRDFIYI